MGDFGTIDMPLSNDTHYGSSSSQNLAIPPASSQYIPPMETTHRRTKGRPPGAKNKPKQPIFITRDNEASLKSTVLQISVGSNIITEIIDYAMKNNVGVTILSGTGSVCDVTLCHPMSQEPSLSFQGPFEMLTLSGSFFSSVCCSFGITFSGLQAQIFGGIVAGKVVAASEVAVVVATVVNPTIHKVPPVNMVEEAAEENMGNMVYGNVTNPTSLNCRMPLDVMHNPTPPRF